MPGERSERSLAERARSDVAVAMDRRGWLTGRGPSAAVKARGRGREVAAWIVAQRSHHGCARLRLVLVRASNSGVSLPFDSPSMRQAKLSSRRHPRSLRRNRRFHRTAGRSRFSRRSGPSLFASGCVPLDGLEAHPLAGTDGAAFPFWSADSRSLGFFTDGALKTIDARGGAAHRVCDAPAGEGGTWNRDGTILFAPGPNTGLHRVSAAGGVSTAVTDAVAIARYRRLIVGRRFFPTAGASSSTKETAFRSDRSIRQTCKR